MAKGPQAKKSRISYEDSPFTAAIATATTPAAPVPTGPVLSSATTGKKLKKADKLKQKKAGLISKLETEQKKKEEAKRKAKAEKRKQQKEKKKQEREQATGEASLKMPELHSLFTEELKRQTELKANEIKKQIQNKFGGANNNKKKKTQLTQREKQKLALQEVNQFEQVLKHPAFRSNAFATIQEHLTNTVAMERDQITRLEAEKQRLLAEQAKLEKEAEERKKQQQEQQEQQQLQRAAAMTAGDAKKTTTIDPELVKLAQRQQQQQQQKANAATTTKTGVRKAKRIPRNVNNNGSNKMMMDEGEKEENNNNNNMVDEDGFQRVGGKNKNKRKRE